MLMTNIEIFKKTQNKKKCQNVREQYKNFLEKSNKNFSRMQETETS